MKENNGSISLPLQSLTSQRPLDKSWQKKLVKTLCSGLTISFKNPLLFIFLPNYFLCMYFNSCFKKTFVLLFSTVVAFVDTPKESSKLARKKVNNTGTFMLLTTMFTSGLKTSLSLILVKIVNCRITNYCRTKWNCSPCCTWCTWWQTCLRSIWRSRCRAPWV